MNAALLLSSMLIAGANPTAMDGCGLGCGNCAVGICAGTRDPMPDESKPPKGGIFSRLKSRIGRKKDDCGAVAGMTTAVADTGGRDGLLSRLRARLSRNKDCAGSADCGGGCDVACGGCDLGCFGTYNLPPFPGTVVPAPMSDGPKEMQKEKDKESGGKGATAAGNIPLGPLVPVSGPPLPPLGSSKNPF